jgi:hypothetical protein
MSKIQIIRALWGNSSKIIDEIPVTPLFENEVVFVWEEKNKEYVEKLGYKTIQIPPNDYTTLLNHYTHKLEAIKVADGLFDEYLFLDWDIEIIKPIDDNFYNLIKNKSPLQCPLYSYSSDHFEIVNKLLINKNITDKNIHDFVNIQEKEMQKYKWLLNNNQVLPCFCFYYTNNIKIGEKLLSIYKENNILTCIEEFAFYLYSNCDLNSYIEKYEPIVIRGKEKSSLNERQQSLNKLNSYINNKINKDIYLVHDEYDG